MRSEAEIREELVQQELAVEDGLVNGYIAWANLDRIVTIRWCLGQEELTEVEKKLQKKSDENFEKIRSKIIEEKNAKA